jgi:mRNA-degrading endonuclease RelE of RelBE toxin-antitoxin system
MANKIKKALAKFTSPEKDIVKELLSKIIQRKWNDFDIEKLNKTDWRAKKGRIRIIFTKEGKVKDIQRRDDHTYRDYK